MYEQRDTHYNARCYSNCWPVDVIHSISLNEGSCQNGSLQLDTGDQDEIDEREKQRILKALPTLSLPGVQWATCNFDEECVEICYYHEETTSASIGQKELRQQLISYLKPPTGWKIKTEELKRKPVWTETASEPGESIADSSGYGRRIGAFVTVEKKGIHALTAGHGLRERQQIRYSNDNRSLGTVEVVRNSTGIEEGMCDAALVKLDGGASTFVQVDEHVERCVSITCKRPVKHLAVEKFCDDPGRVTGTIHIPDYTRYDGTRVIAARCFAVVSSNDDEYFHENGESGLIVTTVPPADGNAAVSEQIVDPVGMLISTDFLEKTNDNRGLRLSVAVPLQRTLHQLSEHPYCNRGSVALIGVNRN